MSRPIWPVTAMAALSLCAGAVLAPIGAQAADLPARVAPVPPPPVLPIFTWTGFYVGAQVGYEAASDQLNELVTVTGNQRVQVLPPTGIPYIYRFSPDGFVGGAHVGANYQIQSFVLGVVGDVEGSTTGGGFVDNIDQPPFGPGGKAHDQLPWRASVRGRVGYAFGNILAFATGGVAFAELRSTYTRLAIPAFPVSAAERFSKTMTGWTVGAGLDYALSEHWIVSGEYRHTDYGRIKNVSLVAFPGITARQHVESDSGEIGVSYKF